jgi:hypothetical protein
MSAAGGSNHILEILHALAQRQVAFVICGGVAAVLHGVERMTLDIDVAVDTQPPNLGRFLEAMEALQLVPRVPLPPHCLLDESCRRRMVAEKGALVFTFIDPAEPWRQVDFSLVEQLSYHRLVDHTVVKTIEGYDFRVVSPQKLIELKRAIVPVREKDLFDIRSLEKIVGGL